MFKRVLALSGVVLISASAVVAQGLVPLVFETKNEWLVDLPAGDFGYGSQFTIVDKETGLVRYYESYEFEGDPIQQPTWQTGFERLPAPVAMLAPLVGGSLTELIVPQPFENKVTTHSPTGYLSNSGIFVTGIGPEAALSFPAVPDQAQFDPVLLVQTGLNNTPNQIQHEALFTSGVTGPYDNPIPLDISSFDYSLTLPVLPDQPFDGSNALVALVVDDQIHLRQPVLDGLQLIGTKDFPSGGQLFYGDFLRTEVSNQIVVYIPGSSNLYFYEINDEEGTWTLSEPGAFDLGQPILMATRFILEGKLFVAVTYVESDEIDIIDLAEEEMITQLQISDQGGAVTGLISMGGDRLIALSGDGGITGKYELFGSDTEGALKSLYAGDVPLDGFENESTQSRANVFFFDESPLSSSTANLLGWASGTTGVAWASKANIQFESVQFQAWADLGVEDGLQQTFLSSTFISDGTNAALANQINDTASIVGLNLYGDERSPVFVSWSPNPGTYDQLQQIEPSFPDGSELFYRTSSSDPWQVYNGPFFPVSDSFTIDYFIQSEAGLKSPIRSVDYVFTLSAFNQDSNGDGIPDYVQAALGLDPFGSGDYDEDTASDLDELIAQTSASDALEKPASGSVLDRGYAENVNLVSLNLDASPWSIGSVGYIDRLTGARLGQAVVKDVSNAAVFSKVPLVQPEGVVAVSTEGRYACDSDNEGERTGFEHLSLHAISAVDALNIDVSYSGGSITETASLWLDGLDAYTAGPVATRSITLGVSDTAFALAMEYALEQEFKAQGFMPEDAQLTLFPNRLGDERWMSIAEVANLEDEVNGVTVFTIGDLWTDLDISATFDAAKAIAINWIEWTYYCTEVYELFVAAQVPHITGQGPVDVLRAILREEEVSAGLLEQLLLDTSEAEAALGEGQGLRESFVRENVQTFDLFVIEPNSEGCFLAHNILFQGFSLFNEDGDRYVSSKTVDMLAGTKVRVQAIVRDDITACSGTALEVRSFKVVELPELAVTDSDGNLLDDRWELFWLGASEYDPFSSIDGSGYSLLQQFLSGNDPLDPTDLPDEAIVDLGAPDIDIAMTGANQVTLTWDWPGEYSDLIQFKLIETDDLGNFSVITPVSVDYSRIGDLHTLIIAVPAGDRRFFKFVLSL